MDDTQRRQLLFGTTPHRRPTAGFGTQQQHAQPHQAGAFGSGSNHDNAHSNIPAASEREMIEQSNDEKVDNLRGHVGEMRHLALDIGDEVRDQNAMLDGMAGNFDNAGDSIRQTIAQIRQLASTSGGVHLCMMFLFMVVFFFLIYLLIR